MGDTATYDNKLRAMETDRARHMPPGLLLHQSDTQHGGKSDQANLQEDHLTPAARLPLAVERHAFQVLDRIIDVAELALSFNGPYAPVLMLLLSKLLTSMQPTA
jgi:hypothetical protein